MKTTPFECLASSSSAVNAFITRSDSFFSSTQISTL
ncbi:hypothetical protein ECTPHS_12253 [Ectothiorhodospira sp. PHS-1]|nr:hypothetical protein ECTPHS_12253 [Ectothiorhodospira sp. PHS-1]